MENLELLRFRRSIRLFQDKAILKADLEKIVDCARFAPTARNVQPWEFVVVTSKPKLTELSRLADNGRFLAQASACIAVFCVDTKYYLEDGCAATCNILLAATALGIGSCWVAGDKKAYSQEVSVLLGLSLGMRLVSLVALGYPQEKDAFKAMPKKDLEEILHWEKF
ncbi:MAG: nitroreductase family protein [Candidatus Omnitrophica bacterium]|jgi:nitroreductase|nr:nitroreductase family protein [Candidatus Omnitrophota bacterium]